MRAKIENFMNGFTKILEYLGGIMLFIGTVVVFIAAISRYLFSHSLPWADEACRMLILACSFWLCGSMETQNRQVALTIVSENIKSSLAHKIFDYIKYIVALIMSVIICINGWKQFGLVEGQFTYSTIFPKQIPTAIVPVGMAICAVYLILKLVLMMTEPKTGKEAE